MAEFVAAFGSSHTVMLFSELDDWIHRYAENDVRLPYFNDEGRRLTYDDVLQAAPKNASELISPDVISARYNEMQAAIARLREEILAAKLDVLVVVGDDQYELFQDTLMPAIGIYYGPTIRNAAKPDPLPDNWYKRAGTNRLEDGAPVDYPVERELALHLVEGLIDREFDITAMSGLREDEVEGHAYSSIHKLYLKGTNVRMVPIFLNTYNPPNPPSPKRCLKLGQEIAALVKSYPSTCRVGFLASGGLSHFIVNERLDQAVLAALRNKDMEYFRSLKPEQLKAGTSEIRCWIVLAGAMGRMNVRWDSYVPGYRTKALTGTGMAFAALR